MNKLFTIRTGGSQNPGKAKEAGQSLRLELRVDDGYKSGGVGRGIELRVKVQACRCRWPTAKFCRQLL